jgi:hypothetical protein
MSNLNHTVSLDYYPNDFFYITNGRDLPKIGCVNVDTTSCIHLDDNDNDKIVKCYQNELCVNKNLVEQLMGNKNKHSQYESQLRDLQNKYRYQLLTSFNLGVGVIATIVYVYYNK